MGKRVALDNDGVAGVVLKYRKRHGRLIVPRPQNGNKGAGAKTARNLWGGVSVLVGLRASDLGFLRPYNIGGNGSHFFLQSGTILARELCPLGNTAAFPNPL